MEMFGPDSPWAQTNAPKQKLVADMHKLQETVLRNHVLQLHQTAQNSRAQFSQQSANKAYALYFKYFTNSPQGNEMVFYRAELLFDMGYYADAAKLYTYVVEKDPKNKYFKQAVENNVLALEKALPSNKEIESKRGNTLDPIPLDPPVAAFEKGAQLYVTNFPKGENTPDILRRLGVIYYSYNHFDRAIEIFRRVMNDYPGTHNAEVAGNLILDIYKLRGDMTGLANEAEALLKNPKIANSKFGGDIKGMLEKASYARADKLSQTGDSITAAKQFETFAASYKASDLAVAARYKAAKAYEKGGDPASAIRMHKMILLSPSQDKKVQAVQLDSRNDLARIYSATGQLELAAREYINFANANPKDPKSINAYYNAAVLLDSLNSYVEAANAYQKYFDSSRKGDRFEVIYAQADLLKRRGANSAAEKKYEEYINTYGNNTAHVAEAMYFLAKQAERKGQQDEAFKWYKKLIGLHKRANEKDKVVEYAAEGRFKLAQDVLKEIRAIKFTRQEAQIGKTSKQLDAIASRYEKEMIDVVKFNNAKWIVAALVSTAQMYELKANKLASVPFPEGYPKEQLKAFEDQKSVGVNRVRNQAKENYKLAHQRAMELETFTEWTELASKGLGELDPSASASAGERASESRAMDWMGL
jgi:cellulose synthase operon protein C